ncbi:MAG: GspH/FimT family pseudopilin [Rhodanobacteraceae bacterium]
MCRQNGTTLSPGFTLVELLIVLAIAGMLAMIGAPAMGSLLKRTETGSAEAAVAGILRHARSAAVMHNTRVLVCPSSDGLHCQTGYDWQHGLLVANDADHDGQPDPGKQALAVLTAMPPGIRITTSAGREHIVFHPDGNAAGSNARFTICHAGETTAKSVVVANSGRVRAAAPDPQRMQQCLAGMP